MSYNSLSSDESTITRHHDYRILLIEREMKTLRAGVGAQQSIIHGIQGEVANGETSSSIIGGIVVSSDVYSFVLGGKYC